MSYQTNSITNIRTIKAMRGESLTIDLGKTFLGTLTAWMKRDPEDLVYRSFDIVDNRYIVLSKLKASDFIDGNGEVLEAVGGKWFFDVEQILDGQPADSVVTIFRGTIQFQNDITGSQGIEVTDPQVLIDNTFISNLDTPNVWGNYRQILQINLAGNGLEFINKTIVGFSGTKIQFNEALTNGNFKFVGDAPTAHVHTFASLTAKPTTLFGYAISDTREKYNASLSDGTFMFLNGTQEVQGIKSFVDGTMFLLNQAKTFGGAFRNTNTTNRLYTLQDKDGVLALVSDIPTLPQVQPLTTKGDLYGFGTGIARLPIGSNGYILMADSAEVLGLKWTPKADLIGATKLDELTDVSAASALNRHIMIGDGNFFNTRRLVVADILDYPTQIDEYISSSTIKALLDNTLSWDINNLYVGAPISGSFQGQNHYNSDYYFQAYANNLWLRLKRVIRTSDIVDYPIQRDAYITDATSKTRLSDITNWNIDGIYTGIVITGTFQEQKHFDTAYFYEATSDNIWIRFPRL